MCALLRGEPLGVRMDARQRHARHDATLHVDERELHVDGARQIRLRYFQLLEFDDVTRLDARPPWPLLLLLGHR
jgi:hypothetical protein